MKEVLATTMPEVTTSTLMYDICPLVGLAFYFLALDKASGNERVIAEFVDETKLCPNLILICTYCFGHGLGLASGESISMYGIINTLYSFAKLVKHHSYHDEFMTHMAYSLRQKANWRRQLPMDQPTLIMESHAYIDRLAEIIVLRDFSTAASSASLHTGDLDSEAGRQVAKSIKEDAVAHLKEYWVVNPRFFSSIFCFVPVESKEEAVTLMFESLGPLLTDILPSGVLAVNRWLSV